MSRPAIFMDRDGTICEEVGYVNHLSRSRLLPGSVEAIRLANDAGFLVVVASNQSGVARGLFDEALVQAVNRQMVARVQEAGARIDAVYFCPHHPREGAPPFRMDCECRKPRPGMLLQAAREHDVDLRSSWMIGDSLVDLEAAAAAGAAPVHVLTGYGRGLVEHHGARFRVAPAHTAEDLLAAVRFIVGAGVRGPGTAVSETLR
jgi:D-glycero-D-manno-heptose 1,7-bisphosphate phosphatase